MGAGAGRNLLSCLQRFVNHYCSETPFHCLKHVMSVPLLVEEAAFAWSQAILVTRSNPIASMFSHKNHPHTQMCHKERTPIGCATLGKSLHLSETRLPAF